MGVLHIRNKETGQFETIKTIRGEKGSDASVTSENIASALGYTPASEASVSQLSEKIESDAYQEDIVQQVIAALGTPVFGRVDADKNIVLTGTLAEGTYTYYFEDTNGERRLIGTDTVEGEPTYTNVLPLAINADGTPYVGNNGEKGYKVGSRIKSDGTEAERDGMCCTGFIPITYPDMLYLINIANSTSDSAVAFYDESFTMLLRQSVPNYKTTLEGKNYALTFDAAGNLITFDVGCLWNWGTEVVNNARYVRFGCEQITDESIITINQPIE
jgi:hypothetical protein